MSFAGIFKRALFILSSITFAISLEWLTPPLRLWSPSSLSPPPHIIKNRFLQIFTKRVTVELWHTRMLVAAHFDRGCRWAPLWTGWVRLKAVCSGSLPWVSSTRLACSRGSRLACGLPWLSCPWTQRVWLGCFGICEFVVTVPLPDRGAFSKSAPIPSWWVWKELKDGERVSKFSTLVVVLPSSWLRLGRLPCAQPQGCIGPSKEASQAIGKRIH